MHMRILVTGSRHYSDYKIIKKALAFSPLPLFPVTVVHGGATGADTLAGQAARELGFIEEVHLADWSIGKKAGPLRNQKMVDLGADICLAFPLADSRGTYDCINRAKLAGIPVKIYN